jgi:galactoside O-acetyltransferase
MTKKHGGVSNMRISFILSTFKRIYSRLNAENSWTKYSANTSIHPSVKLEPGSTVDFRFIPEPGVRYLEILEGSQIFGQFTFLTKNSRIRIGRNCQVGSSSFICQESISIGDEVLISWGSTFIDSDTHSPNIEDRVQDIADWYAASSGKGLDGFSLKDWSKVTAKPISIGNRVWIGFNSMILKGVQIGANSVIGAGSVVRTNVDHETTVIGNPAQVISKKI